MNPNRMWLVNAMLMLVNGQWWVRSMLYWSRCCVTLRDPSEALLWSRSNPCSPRLFGAPRRNSKGPLCLCMLLFPLHAQTPSPPRCARRDLGPTRANQATPGSPQLWRSADGTKTPTGNGLDLHKKQAR